VNQISAPLKPKQFDYSQQGNRCKVAKIEIPVRVYYEDTDAAGVVYYARYLHFMERARTDWLRALGIEQQALVERENIVFVVSRVEVDYHRPARLDDLLTVTAEVVERRRVGFTFDQEIRRQGDGELLCSGRVSAACLDAARMRPRALPEALMKKIVTEIENGF